MKLAIPKTASLSNQVLTERFFKRYYPELSTKNVWTIWGTHTRLQKNPFVCALFRVQHQAHQTDIVMEKGTTRRASLTDLFFLNYFIRGDFYTELEKDLRKFLREEYGYRDKDIVNIPCWWSQHWRKIVMPIVILLWSVLVTMLYSTSVNSLSIEDFYPSAPKVYAENSDYELVEIPGARLDSAYYDEVDDSATHPALLYRPTGEILKDVYELPLVEYNGYAVVQVMTDGIDNEYRFKAPNRPLQVLEGLDYNAYFTEEGLIVTGWSYGIRLYNLSGEEVNAYIPTVLPYLQNEGVVLVFFLTLIMSTVLYLRPRRKRKQRIQKGDETTMLHA